MLVLSRKKGESVQIGNDIIVTVVEIRGDKVRLGIEAPRDLSVHRQEVYQAIRNAKKLTEESTQEASDPPTDS